MSSEELRRLQRQQEANAIAIQRLQQQGNYQPPEQEQYETYEQPQHYQQQPRYQQEDPNKVLINNIINEAGNRAADKAADMMLRQTQTQNTITEQMKELVAKYPALKQDDSPLVAKARELYSRVKQENPTLPEHTIYRMAVNEAATYIGARPVDAPIDDLLQDFTISSNKNPALPKKTGSLKRLTSSILANAQMMGINVDKNTPEGKKNLEELAFYTARFNADKDESEYGYR